MAKSVKRLSAIFKGINVPNRQYVSQGHEELSAFRPQYSEGFTKCSGIVLINVHDGVTLFKHSGPIAMSYDGIEFGENYKRFLQHVEAHGKSIIAIAVYGKSSVHGSGLVKELEKQCAKNNIACNVQGPLHVPSDGYHWHMSYDPNTGQIVTKHYDAKNKKDIFTPYQVQGLDPSQFEKDSAQKIHDELCRKEYISDISYKISGRIYCAEPEVLTALLHDAEDRLGRDGFYPLIADKLASYDRENPLELCLKRLHQAFDPGWKGKVNVASTIECFKVIFDYLQPDDLMKINLSQKILSAVLQSKNKDHIQILDQLLGQLTPTSNSEETVELISEAGPANMVRLASFLQKQIDNVQHHIDKKIKKFLGEQQKEIPYAKVYLWQQIGKGQAPGHTREDFFKHLKKHALTLIDIGVTEQDVDRAFSEGQFLEKVRDTVGDYMCARITKKVFDEKMVEYQNNDMGLDVIQAIELTETRMAMYTQWHQEAQSKKKKAPGCVPS